MRSLAWGMAHVAAMIGVHVVAWAAGDSGGNLLLYAIPLAIGAVQWAFLRRDLGWWGGLWLPSSVLGLFLSFLGVWWFLLVIGAGMGIAQAPILAVSGFRRWWAWVPASAAGWFGGMMLGSLVVSVVGSGVDGLAGAGAGAEAARMIVLYGVTALVYGSLTAAALHLMPRAGAAAMPGGERLSPRPV